MGIAPYGRVGREVAPVKRAAENSLYREARNETVGRMAFLRQKQFLSSFRCNKTTPEEYGLVWNEECQAYLHPGDNSAWVQMELYDFGWGKEYGFCKLPMPDFEQLFELLMTAHHEDDRYGAAAVLLDVHADRLLEKCLEIIHTNSSLIAYRQAFLILGLDKPVNRSTTLGKTFGEIQSDYSKWEYIAEKVQEIHRLV